MPKGKPAGEEKRWCCLCAYDGTDFAGWQKQPNRRAIQDKIEEVLKEIFGSRIRTIGSGEPMREFMQNDKFFILTPRGHIQSTLLQAMRVNFPEGIRPIKLRRGFRRFSLSLFRQLERGTAIG